LFFVLFRDDTDDLGKRGTLYRQDAVLGIEASQLLGIGLPALLCFALLG
jgi:hypothetical protein